MSCGYSKLLDRVCFQVKFCRLYCQRTARNVHLSNPNIFRLYFIRTLHTHFTAHRVIMLSACSTRVMLKKPWVDACYLARYRSLSTEQPFSARSYAFAVSIEASERCFEDLSSTLVRCWWDPGCLSGLGTKLVARRLQSSSTARIFLGCQQHDVER
jgi:hypothetical protein